MISNDNCIVMIDSNHITVINNHIDMTGNRTIMVDNHILSLWLIIITI